MRKFRGLRVLAMTGCVGVGLSLAPMAAQAAPSSKAPRGVRSLENDQPALAGGGVRSLGGGPMARATAGGGGAGYFTYDLDPGGPLLPADEETFTLRLVSNGQGNVETLRTVAEQAAAQVSLAGGATVTVAAGTVSDTTPDLMPTPGEILLSIDSTSECSGSWAGCARPDDNALRSDGVQAVSSGRAWIHPSVLGYTAADQAHVVAHELGHTLGLDHYDSLYGGQYQVMHSSSYDATSYRSGDQAGLAFLRVPQRFAIRAGDFSGGSADDLLWHGGNRGLIVAQSGGSSFTQHNRLAGGFGNADVAANAARYFQGDFNGDGKQDLLWHGGDTDGLYVATASAAGFTQSQWLAGGFGSTDVIANAKRYFVGDFNGDGKDDLLWHGGDSDGIYVAVSSGTAFTQVQWLAGGFGNNDVVANAARYFVGDFNGDGKDDLLWHGGNASGLYVAVSSGTGFTQAQWLAGGFGSSDVIANAKRYFVGDFNGDGKDELLWHGGDASGLYVAVSSGTAFTQAQWLGGGFGNNDVIANSARYFVGDFNGDGKDDLLWHGGDASGLNVAVSSGTAFTQSQWLGGGFGNGDVVANAGRYVVGDFTGDGKTDLAWNGGLAGVWVAASSGTAFTQSSWMGTNFPNFLLL